MQREWLGFVATHQLRRWVCQCAPAAAGLSVPSEWGCTGSKPQQDTDTQAPWTHTRNISDKPAKKEKKRKSGQVSTSGRHNLTDLSCGYRMPSPVLQLNSSCGLESVYNHGCHIQKEILSCNALKTRRSFIKADKSVGCGLDTREPAYFERVPRYHQSAVMFSPESVELQVGFPSRCHLWQWQPHL